MRVTVVGGGVLGMSVAWHLLQGGAQVTMVDPAGPGGGTSGRGAGLVCEGQWHPTSLALVRRSMKLLRAMAEETDFVRFHQVGSTTLVPAAGAEAARRIAAAQRAQGADVAVLTPREAAQLPRHDQLSFEGVEVALHYAKDGWAMPRMYCEMLGWQAEEEGMVTHTTPARLVLEAGRIQVEGIASDAIVLATGVWTRGLLRAAQLDAPLLAYRTQAQRYAHPKGHELPILHDAVQGFYLRPSWPGQLLVGNGTTTIPEDVNLWREDADEAFVAASTRRLHARVPAMRDARATDGWAGLDAATPDRLMLAGPHPEAPEVWLAVGGNGHGFMRAPATGEAIAARLLGKTPRVDISAYDPARFGDAWSDDFAIREGYTLEP